jgi:hypothetical protein
MWCQFRFGRKIQEHGQSDIPAGSQVGDTVSTDFPASLFSVVSMAGS